VLAKVPIGQKVVHHVLGFQITPIVTAIRVVKNTIKRKTKPMRFQSPQEVITWVEKKPINTEKTVHRNKGVSINFGIFRLPLNLAITLSNKFPRGQKEPHQVLPLKGAMMIGANMHIKATKPIW
jgi:hypothetical protein